MVISVTRGFMLYAFIKIKGFQKKYGQFFCAGGVGRFSLCF